MKIGNITNIKRLYALSFCLLCALSVSGLAQSNGALRGVVTIGDTEKPVHNVRVTIIQLKRSVETDEKGAYEFQNVLPGRYDVTAHLDLAPDCDGQPDGLIHDRATARGANNFSQRLQPERQALFQSPLIHQGIRAGDRARRETGLYNQILLRFSDHAHNWNTAQYRALRVGQTYYSVNYVVWHFSRISLRLRVRESELRYGTGSGSDRAPLTRSLPLPVPYRMPDRI